MSGKIRFLIFFLCSIPAILWAEDPYELALKEYRAGEYLKAKSLLLKKDSKKAGDYNLLGWISLKINSLEEALFFFNKSLEMNSDIADSYCGLGFLYYYKKDFEKSMEFFNKGLEIKKDHADCIEGKSLVERFVRINKERKEKIQFFVRGDYFWKKEGGNEPELFFIKGVNIGFGIPGKYATEFPTDERIYEEWFKEISRMGANLIRIYTILPPEFYRAFKRHNENGNKLFLIQGIWAEPPENSDFKTSHYLENIKREIRDAVDVIHGNADIPQRYGHAYGVYRTDISEYVLAFIFGREWEPYAVITFNSRYRDKDFEGKFLSINNGNAFEVWLTEMLDYLISYESERYNVQRPVAFMNWPTLDPLYHQSEATFMEEIEIRKRLGENISLKDFSLSGIFDDDAVSINENKIIVDPSFRSGIFASYHVYPYYPDFLRNDPNYEISIFPDAIRYFNYLKILKNHYKDMPLLISEFGLSTSRGIARFHVEGFHHGGLSEEEQAEGLKRLFYAIKESRSAGGIIFSWIDEWFKSNWMVRAFENNDPLWYNAEDPEENFGIMAMLLEKTAERLNNNYKWSEGSKIYCSDGRALKCLSVDHDEGYLYLKLDIKKWHGNITYLIAIDTYGDSEGDHLLPRNLGIISPIGFEFVVLISKEDGMILVDDFYARTVFDPDLLKYPGMSGYRENSNFGLIYNKNGKFVEIITIHRRRFSRDGKVFPERIYNASLLRKGKDFLYSEDSSIEVRIPWGLIGFSDPSKKEVIIDKKERKKTEGVRFFAIAYETDANQDAKEILDKLPSDFREIKFYTWQEWILPSYKRKAKKAYHIMKEVFENIVNPEIRFYLPIGFNFQSQVMAHYNSLNDFLKLYEQSTVDKDLFGEGISYLIRGLIKEDPFYILEAKRYFSFINRRFRTKEAEIAGYGLKYIDNLFNNGYKKNMTDIVPQRISVKKIKPERRDFHKIVIGRSFIKIDKGFRIKTQVDRVIRDWLSGWNHSGSPSSYSKDTLVPWHEGKKILEILSLKEVFVEPVWGTIARKIGNIWYAPDEKGIYRFPLSEDKIYNYPGNFILDHDTVVINDTHGISSIAWDGVDADLIIGCGDHEGKVEAAYYLASKGINVYMPTDRFLPLLIGTKTEGKIIGSAPVKISGESVIIGDQPVKMEIEETIVVSNTKKGYPLQYYDTPYRYFKELEEYLQRPLKLIAVDIEEEGQAGLVVQKAEETGAKIIGIRIRTKEEYKKVSEWLRRDKTHRAILFHSAVYDEGYRLFFEFPEQTSFGDINIELE